MSFDKVFNDIMEINESHGLEERRRRYLKLADLLLHFDDDMLRTTVTALNNAVDDGFYMEKTSYRKCPQENSDGGILKHSARGVKIASHYVHLFNLTHQQQSELWCSLLLHDSFKNYDPVQKIWIPGKGNQDHAAEAARQLEKFFLDNMGCYSNYNQLRESLKNVLYNISVHTNRFDPNAPHNIQELPVVAQILVISDYYVSQCGFDL